MNISNLLTSVSAPDPVVLSVKTDLSPDQLNMNLLRVDPAAWVTQIMRLSEINERDAYRTAEQEVKEHIDSFGLGIDGNINLDPDLHEGLAGNVKLHIRQVSSDKYRCWALFSADQEVWLNPDEMFKFDVGKLESHDVLVFIRELSRHPNHQVLLAFWAQFAMLMSNDGAVIDPFNKMVSNIRRSKRGLLQAVLSRADDYSEVENILMAEGRPIRE